MRLLFVLLLGVALIGCGDLGKDSTINSKKDDSKADKKEKVNGISR